MSDDIKVYDKLYIDGAWAEPAGSGTIDVINSTTEEVMGRVPEATEDDVNRAVAAAKTAFEEWSQTPVDERKKGLLRLQEALGARQEEIAQTIAREVGMTLTLSRIVQAGLPIAEIGGYAQAVDEVAWEEEIGNSLVVKEPVGVIGCITPWNYPLLQIMRKVAPAIAAGCTVVVKPTEVAPLAAFILAEVVDEIGLPPGVFNLVCGTGPVAGEALAGHPDVDMVHFTGSTRAGKRISELAAGRVARVALELGGKSPNIILDDADLERAVTAGIGNCFLNSGQTCTALTRMLVPRERHDEAVEIARKAAEEFTVGDPLEESTKLGPLISEQQRERVRDYIRKGIDEGADLVIGGDEAPENLPTGYFVKPTVFANVSNDMTIAQEEIFGPVLSIIPYDDEDDAVRIANDTIYGLAAAVWSGDDERAQRVARRIRSGQVEVNGGAFNPAAPFGGFKQSGHGRELGKYGLEEFLEIKSMQL